VKKEIIFRAACDKRNADPKNNYGVHGVDMVFFLHGAKGVVQFVVFTGWMLDGIKNSEPLPADLGYHSYEPIYEGQSVMSEKCECLGGKRCYYDGSGLAADEVFGTLRREGSDGVWREMADYYKSIFGESP